MRADLKGKEFNKSEYYATEVTDVKEYPIQIDVNLTSADESPPDEEYKWSDEDLNISQWDDEYPPKELKLTELDGNWTDVNESLYNSNTLINDGRKASQLKWVDYPMDDTEIIKEMERNRLILNTIQIIRFVLLVTLCTYSIYLARKERRI